MKCIQMKNSQKCKLSRQRYNSIYLYRRKILTIFTENVYTDRKRKKKHTLYSKTDTFNISRFAQSLEMYQDNIIIRL